LLEALPPSAEVQVYVELDDPADQPALDAVHPRATLHWMPRRSDADPYPGWRIEQALRDVPLPPGDGRVYVACESDAVRRIRRQLLEERGLTPARLVTRGYWKRGRADHPDRDYGEDLPPAA
jgi:NADPH-dependent ferric siderophore reductase